MMSQYQSQQQPLSIYPPQAVGQHPPAQAAQVMAQHPRQLESDVVTFPLNKMLTLSKSQTKTVRKNLKRMRATGNTDGGILLAIPFMFYDGKKAHKHNKVFSIDSSDDSTSSSSSDSTEYEFVKKKKVPKDDASVEGQ
ncbi:MAG: hypothetical protein J5614_02530 [Paludibacteraceae bacterium]|nr:hypothetical protein [Paludibacteraceae bacterium]